MLLASVIAGCLAASPGPLAAAEEAFQSARYEEVLPALKQARQGSLSPREQARSWELEALTLTAFGRSAASAAAWRSLLRVAPSYRPGPDASPKVRESFAVALEGWVEERALLPAARPAAPSPAPVSPGPPLWRRGGFWAAAAGVVLAGLGGGYLLTRKARRPEGTLGRETFP